MVREGICVRWLSGIRGGAIPVPWSILSCIWVVESSGHHQRIRQSGVLSWKFEGMAGACVAVGVKLVYSFARSIPVGIEIFCEKGS